jgi:chromosome segregation ATPase
MSDYGICPQCRNQVPRHTTGQFEACLRISDDARHAATVRVAKIEAERDELSANLSSANAQLRALADEVGDFSAKIAKQVDELNTVIRQKWEIEAERDALAAKVSRLTNVLSIADQIVPLLERVSIAGDKYFKTDATGPARKLIALYRVTRDGIG